MTVDVKDASGIDHQVNVLMTFNAAAAIPAELDRIFRITDGVMRSMIVCKDE